MNGREIGKPGGTSASEKPLLADAQPLDQASVSLVIVLAEIIEKPSPLADQHEEPAAGSGDPFTWILKCSVR
jgi:hypothetical protein